MTKLDIFLEWFLFVLALGTALGALLQAAGVPLFTDRNAVNLLAISTNLSVFLPLWVKKGQDLYDKIQLARKK